MPKLQRTFNYSGNSTEEIPTIINLEFNFPQYTYKELVQSQDNFERDRAIARSSVIPHKTKSNLYHFELPRIMVIGNTPSSQYGFFRYHKLKNLSKDKIEDFAFQTQLSVTDDFNTSIFQTSFDLIYGIKSPPLIDTKPFLEEEQKFKAAYGTLDKINVDNLQKLVAADYDKIFILNKKAYDELLESISSLLQRTLNNDLYLLLLIELLIDLTGDSPKLSNYSTEIQWIQTILNRSGIMEQEMSKVLSLINDTFDTLIDFPIQISSAELLSVKGSLMIDSEETIEEEDLSFYNLSIEYSLKGGGAKISRYNWSQQNQRISNNQVGFTFPAQDLTAVDHISNLVTVKVKGIDGAILWRQSFRPQDPELQKLEIEVNHNPPSRFGLEEIQATLAFQRLRGKVIQFASKHEVGGLTVLIQAKEEEDESWQTVGSATTDDSGNFSLHHPSGEYVKAQAIVTTMPNDPVNIHIDLDKNGKSKISDNFIYILLLDHSVIDNIKDNHEHSDDCGCNHDSNNAKRLPDQVDLIDSDEYTQDLGGSCLNLSTPNRSLREYSYNAIVRLSDPDVANYTLEKEEIEGKTIYRLGGGATKINRRAVDLDNPISWQDAPGAEKNMSFYQSVTVATGHILHFKSVFKADGYSLGDLIYSLPLAPGQKKQIVVLESAHRLTGRESQSISQGEELSSELYTDRFITDQLSGSINERLDGSSQAYTSGSAAGAGLSIGSKNFGLSLGASGGSSKSRSNASQSSGRNISQSFDEQLRQSLLQNAESYRKLNASVVTTVTEGQNYGVTSESVANHNHCHSLTMMYFEVLRHYAIYQELSHVEECVFVPLLMTNFTTENIHKWKDVLAVNLRPIPSNTYLNSSPSLSRKNSHPLLKAFDANERVKTDYSRVDYPEGTYADDNVTHIKGRFTLDVNITRPKTKYDRIMSFPIASRTVESVEVSTITAAQSVIHGVVRAVYGTHIVYTTIEEDVIYTERIFNEFMSLDANYESVPPAQCIRITEFEPKTLDEPNVNTTGENFFEDDIISEKLWKTYAIILEYDDVWDMLNTYFKGRLIAEWDAIFYNEMLPQIFANILDSIIINGLDLDFSTSGNYTGGNKRMKINFKSKGLVGQRRSSMDSTLNILVGNPEIRQLKNHIKLNISTANIVYQTDHFQGTLFRGYVNDDLLDGTSLYIPLTSRDLKDPRKEDIYLVDQLLEHLNSNLEYYNKVLWYNLDEDRRFMLLDGFHIETFNSLGHSAGFKSLASVVKNELISIAGNSLVFPVSDGYKVSQSMIIEVSDDVEQEVSLISFYKPDHPIPPYRISVPTRGVFLEAVQGGCDACEMVKEDSSQDWDRFRTEEPTAINSIATPSVSNTAYQAKYEDLKDTLVKIATTPPTLPDPALGLKELSTLLTKENLFKDITGLEKNQANALEAYKLNEANTKAFAETSKILATQFHNTANSGDFLKAIDDAIKKKLITEEQAQEFVKQHFAQRLNGGEIEKTKKAATVSNTAGTGDTTPTPLPEPNGDLSTNNDLFLFVRDRYTGKSPIVNAKLSIKDPNGVIVDLKTNANGLLDLPKKHLGKDGEYTIALLISEHVSDYSIKKIVNITDSDHATGEVTTWKFTVKNKIITTSDVDNVEVDTLEVSNNNVTALKKGLRLKFTPLWLKSPFQSSRSKKNEYIIIYNTENIGATVKDFSDRNNNKKASIHYIIGIDGKLIKMVDGNKIANHAGPSYWKGSREMDKIAIGIGFEMKSDKKSYTDVQYETLITLLNELTSVKYQNIKKMNIIAHSDIATNDDFSALSGDKSDPNHFFDWEKLETEGYAELLVSNVLELGALYHGIFNEFPNLELRVGDSDNDNKYGGVVRVEFAEIAIIKEIQEDLKTIGYRVNTDGVYTDATKYAIRAFQLRMFTSSRKVLLEGDDNYGKINAITAQYIRRCIPSTQEE